MFEDETSNVRQEGVKQLTEREKGRLIRAIARDDIDELKTLINPSVLQNFDDELSRNLLVHCFELNREEIFAFLLSQRGYNVNACDYRGSSALMYITSLTRPESDFFALELVKKGADIHSVDSEGNSLLHYAVGRGCCRLARALVEFGINVNAQNRYGYTALHRLLMRGCPEVVEMMGVLLWNGADLSICDKGGDTPLELVLSSVENRLSAGILEVLLYYAYEDVVPCRVVLEMIRLRLPLFDQVVDQIKEITIDLDFLEADIFWSLFSMDVKYLKILVDRFDYVILELLPLNMYNLYTNFISMESFECLLQSHLASNIIDFIKEIRIISLMEVYYHNMYQKTGIAEETVMELIYYLLSYGLEVHENDLEAVYNNFGNCDLFKFLLHTDIQKIYGYKKDIWLSLLYDFGETDIDTFLLNPHLYSWKNLKQLPHYFSDHRLKELCTLNLCNNKKIMVVVENLPQVPLLVELARNAFRKFFVEKFRIKTSKQFYRLLRCVPISIQHEKIITLEKKLYF